MSMMKAMENLKSETSKLIYLYVKNNSIVTIEQIKNDLHLKYLTVLTIVSKLIDIGYIKKVEDSGSIKIKAIN